MARRSSEVTPFVGVLLGIDHRGTVPSVKRSGKWPKVEKAHLADHPGCAVCGATKQVNVHHVKPYHLFPELELEAGNLITLCCGEHDHHLLFGHLGDFKAFNPTVRADAEIWAFKIQTARHMLKMIRGMK